jgi:hypothetical protein
MLRPDSADTSIVPGTPIYSDDTYPNVFYALPNEPRYRLDDKGHPVFKFIKYRSPLSRSDGTKGGGLVFFDCEFVLNDADQQKILTALQAKVQAYYSAHNLGTAPDPELRMPPWTKGTASLNLIQDNALIEGYKNPAHPSLFGKNITPFFVELTQDGAALFWQALQGQGGVFQVSYELTAAVGCPVEADATFNMQKYYDFVQTIRVDDPWWGDDSSQSNTITEQFRNSGAENIKATFPPGTDPKLQASVMDHLYKFMETMITTETPGDITPVSQEDRKAGNENVDKHITITKTSDFSYHFFENQAIDWSFNPQGTLPNITSIPGVKWTDYASEVDLNDPFFQQIRLTTRVNADFAALPINSVDVNIDYGTNVGNGYHFASANDVGKFAAYMTDNNGSRKYKYNYTVNYTDESNAYSSPTIEIDAESLTINVGGLGILDVHLQAGGAINFDQVQQAQVTIHYEDPANNVVAVEQVLVLDKDHREAKYQKAIFAPRDKAYHYKVLYVMSDGTQFNVDWQDHLAGQLFLNGPFTARAVYPVRVLGSFDTDIDTVFLDLSYNDATNNYTLNKSIALNKQNPFFDWSFGVIDPTAGQVTYQGTIKHKDGTDEDIPATVATERTIKIGAVALILSITVVPDLIDWKVTRLVTASIRYQDPANGIDSGHELTIHQGDKLSPITIDLKDKTKTAFTWEAMFYMTDHTIKSLAGTGNIDDPVVVLDPDLAKTPAAVGH